MAAARLLLAALGERGGRRGAAGAARGGPAAAANRSLPAGLASAGKMKIVEEPNTFGCVSARSLVPRPGRARGRLPLPPGPGVPLPSVGAGALGWGRI